MEPQTERDQWRMGLWWWYKQGKRVGGVQEGKLTTEHERGTEGGAIPESRDPISGRDSWASQNL